MKLKKINEEHYVVVDETIQPVNGYYYDFLINKIKSTNGAEYGEASHCWQITHSTQPIDERGYWGKVMPLTLTIFEIKELLGEVDMEWKYTEEDIKKAIEFGHTSNTPFADVHYSNFIQSLHPKTEWEVEFINGKLTLI